MPTDQEHHQNLHQDRANEAKKNSPPITGSQKIESQSDESKRYSKLQQSRTQDSKKNMQQAIASDGVTKRAVPGRSLRSKKLSMKNASPETALSAALAFTAVDFEKDGIHFSVLFISILADLVTLIPLVGSFLAIPFSLTIWVLYAIGGHLKNRLGRKAVVTATAQAMELLGFAFLSMLPFYTIAAIINYWFALTERKIAQQEAKKNQ